MKNKNVIVLTLVTLAVVTYTYIFEYKKRQETELKKEQDELVLKVSKDDIKRLTVINKEKIVLERQGEVWKITHPVVDDADSLQINSLLDLLLKEKAEIEIGDDIQDLKIYGLDKPLAGLEIEDKKGATVGVSLGAEALLGKNYLRLNKDNNVIVSSSQWKVLTERTLKELRSKTIYRGGNIRTVEVEVPSEKSIVLKLTEGKWKLEGEKFPVDEPAIKAFVAQVENLHATEIAAENQQDLAKYGLNQPAVTLRLIGKDDKDPVTVRISKPQNNKKDSFLISSALKPVFKSFGSLSDSFLRRPVSFRDKEEPFHYSLSDVIGVRTKASQFEYRFIKKGEAWYLEKPEVDRDVDQTELLSLLTSLQGARVREYLGKISFKPQRTIDLLDKEGNSLLKVELGDEIKGKNRRLAKTSRVDEVFSVDANLVDALPGQSLVKEKAKKQ